MPDLRAMTNLAVQPGVSAQLLLLDNFSVTALTDFVTSMRHGASGHFRDGVSTIVSVLAE